MANKSLLIASDSFKGTLSSLDICDLFRRETKNKDDILLKCIPIADGGEGSLDSISSIVKGKFVGMEVVDLYFSTIYVRFFVTDTSAYIECASCDGLSLAAKNNNPGLTTTYGIGEQIKKAIELGKKDIYVFLGGSASNDGGVGMASALGVKFFNKDDEEFIPTGINLNEIVRIDTSEAGELLKGVSITALSDVISPFYGPEGAAFKFAKQKGATPEQIKLLDEGLIHLANIIKKDIGTDVNVPGAGAAGGLGGGIYALLKGKISSGITRILELIDFDNLIKDYDYIVSGEGKLDKQTLDGKVIDGIAKYCNKHNKKLILIVGISEMNEEEIKKIYPCVYKLYESNEKHLPFDKIKRHAEKDYLKCIEKMIKII